MAFHEEWLIAHACAEEPHPVYLYIEPDDEGRLWLSLYDDNSKTEGVMIVNVALGDLKKVAR